MPTVGGAFTFLEERGQELFGDVDEMLYVGHRADTHPWWRTEFAAVIGNPELAVMDIDQNNLNSAQSFAKRLIHGDVRHHAIAGFGLVFWDEGPEHVAKLEALETCVKLAMFNDHVLISCPWGYQPQGSGPEDHEFHHWGPMPEDFQSIGFKTAVFGVMFNNGGHGNLIAWI